jgi:hypothetical protein
MLPNPEPIAATGAGPTSQPAPAWQWQQVASPAQGQRWLDALQTAMADLGYDERARERVRRVLVPALASALWCGQRQEPAGPVSAGYQLGADRLLAEVEGRELTDKGLPVQGPHDPQVLHATAGVDPVQARAYAWLRCDRHDGRLQVCRYWSVP